jgi:hypothetical protein
MYREERSEEPAILIVSSIPRSRVQKSEPERQFSFPAAAALQNWLSFRKQHVIPGKRSCPQRNLEEQALQKT